MAGKIKLKPDTGEMIKMIASKADVDIESIRYQMRYLWQDIDFAMRNCIGTGIVVDNLGSFFMYFPNVGSYVKKLEKIIYKRQKTLKNVLKYIEEGNTADIKLAAYQDEISLNIGKIVLLNCAFNEYESEILSIYPKKYKPVRKDLNAVTARLEQYFNISFTKIPITIDHPIQKVYVQNLQKKGFLSNPVFYKDKPL